MKVYWPYLAIALTIGSGIWLIFVGESETKLADVGVGLLSSAIIGLALIYIEEERTGRIEAARLIRKEEEKELEVARRNEERRIAEERDVASRRLAVQQFLSTREVVSGLKLPRQKLDLLFVGDVSLLEADLSDCDLSAANFAYSRVSGSDFSGADLAGAVLASAVFTSCDFDGADLRDADLAGAEFIECSFRATLTSFSDQACSGERCTDPPKSWVNFAHT